MMIGISLGLTAMRGGTSAPPAAPVISITSGSGYAGSVYTSTVPGQWYADDVAIAGVTGATWTMTAALEGAKIRCEDSNVIQMWTLPQIPGVVFDLDAARGVTQVDGRASAWASAVGPAVAIQATASAQPTYVADAINGRPAVKSPGSRQLQLPSLTHPSLWLAVFAGSFDDLARTAGVILTSDIVGVTRMAQNLRIDSGNFQSISFNASGGNINLSSAATTAKRIYLAELTADAYRTRVDGVVAAENTTAFTRKAAVTINPGVFALIGGGASSSSAATIGELALFDRSMMTAQHVIIIEGVLAHKFGTVAALPADHPYKTAAPQVTA